MTVVWCRLCGGQGFIIEKDLDSARCPPVDRSKLFQDGRTEVCPRCRGDGREVIENRAAFGWAGWIIFWLLCFMAGGLGWLIWTGAF